MFPAGVMSGKPLLLRLGTARAEYDMTKYRGILFDKDGTLFSFAETWSPWATEFFDILSDGDRERAIKMGARVGYDYEQKSFARESILIGCTSGEIAQVLLPLTPEMTVASLVDQMSELSSRIRLAQVVDLPALMDRFIKNGIKLGVATNDTEVSARSNLDQLGVTHKFNFISGFDSGHGGKPEPGMLLAFARRFDIDPAECLMVGDSTHDLHAGRAAGMTTVGVLTGIAEADELASHADVILPDIGHLPEWLGLPA